MSADVRALAVVCAVIAGVGFGAGLLGVADQLAVAALVVAAIGWPAIRRVQQELRIRRRVADTAGTRRAPRPAGTGPHRAPAPSAASPTSSTAHSSPDIPRPAVPAERVTERTGGAA